MAKFLEVGDLREQALARIIVDWTNGHALFSEAYPGYVQIQGQGESEANPIFVQFPGTFDVTLDDGWEVTSTIDEGLNDSSKQWDVPAGWLWQILFIGVTLATSATAGNRQVDVRLQRAGTAMWVQLARAGAVQAASTTYSYLFASGAVDLTAVRDTTFLSSPLPVGLILRGGDTLRVWDNKAIAAATDDLSVWVQYARREA